MDSGPLEEDLIREHAANGYSAETSPIAQSFSPTTTQEIEDCLRHLKLRLLTDSGHARQSSTLDRSPVDLAQDLSIEEFQNSPRPSTHAGSDRDLEQHILYPIATLGLARDSKSNRNKSRKMNAARGSRFLDLPKGAEDKMLKQKIAVAQEAQKQQTFIAEKLRRNGHEMPPFTFLELIGKGSYGRVFKWYVYDPYPRSIYRIGKTIVLLPASITSFCAPATDFCFVVETISMADALSL